MMRGEVSWVEFDPAGNARVSVGGNAEQSHR